MLAAVSVVILVLGGKNVGGRAQENFDYGEKLTGGEKCKSMECIVNLHNLPFCVPLNMGGRVSKHSSLWMSEILQYSLLVTIFRA